MSVLEAWNRLTPAEAADAVLACTGSTRWARLLAAGRPHQDEAEFLQDAYAVWWNLRNDGLEDWLEAFASHPRIGERKTHGSEQAKVWSDEEQSSSGETSELIQRRLAVGNRLYEERFGFVYLVCATGRSAAELLETLESRLENSTSHEIYVAADEASRIMILRLRKWLDA